MRVTVSAQRPEVVVVVPTLALHDRPAGTVRQLVRALPADWPILVCASGARAHRSVKATVANAPASWRLQVVLAPRGYASARNAGVRAASPRRGWLFVDDDVHVTEQAAVAIAEASRSDAVFGLPLRHLYQRPNRFAEAAFGPVPGPGRVDALPGGLLFVPRRVIDAGLGFAPVLDRTGGEDTALTRLACQAGFEVLRGPDLGCTTTAPPGQPRARRALPRLVAAHSATASLGRLGDPALWRTHRRRRASATARTVLWLLRGVAVLRPGPAIAAAKAFGDLLGRRGLLAELDGSRVTALALGRARPAADRGEARAAGGAPTTT